MFFLKFNVFKRFGIIHRSSAFMRRFFLRHVLFVHHFLSHALHGIVALVRQFPIVRSCVLRDHFSAGRVLQAALSSAAVAKFSTADFPLGLARARACVVFARTSIFLHWRMHQCTSATVCCTSNPPLRSMCVSQRVVRYVHSYDFPNMTAPRHCP